jgi:hypothetical protein
LIGGTLNSTSEARFQPIGHILFEIATGLRREGLERHYSCITKLSYILPLFVPSICGFLLLLVFIPQSHLLERSPGRLKIIDLKKKVLISFKQMTFLSRSSLLFTSLLGAGSAVVVEATIRTNKATDTSTSTILTSYQRISLSGTTQQQQQQPYHTTSTSSSSNRNLIIGGHDATAGRYPYFVALQSAENNTECGGTLIAPDVVLTAAHCAA